ncbi:MAG: hypothetical protein WA970_03580 [Gammaproteobacteria bacterium]
MQWIEEGVVFTLRPGCKKPGSRCPDLEDPCIGLDDYVCQHVERSPCLEAPGELCPIGKDDWWYDPKHGVPLACVEICDFGEACKPRFGFSASEPCEARQTVYRNPLLFELVQGCQRELARVESLSFQDWLQHGRTNPLPWCDFAEGMQKGVEVRFTKPIKQETLHAGSVFLSAIVREHESNFHDVLRIPTYEMRPLSREGELVRSVQLIFPKKWIDTQIKDEELSRFESTSMPSIIELTVRSSLLRDECGRVLDGRPLDMQADEPGQSMPGVDFVVTFYVAPISAAG